MANWNWHHIIHLVVLTFLLSLPNSFISIKSMTDIVASKITVTYAIICKSNNIKNPLTWKNAPQKYPIMLNCWVNVIELTLTATINYENISEWPMELLDPTFTTLGSCVQSRLFDEKRGLYRQGAYVIYCWLACSFYLLANLCFWLSFCFSIWRLCFIVFIDLETRGKWKSYFAMTATYFFCYLFFFFLRSPLFYYLAKDTGARYFLIPNTK